MKDSTTALTSLGGTLLEGIDNLAILAKLTDKALFTA